MDSFFCAISRFLPRDRLADWFVAPTIILLILLLGFGEIFSGSTVFVDEDTILNFDHNANNKKSNGWRPDVALGVTNHFCDSGLCHTWNLSRWWAELFENDIFAFQLQVMLFIWLACLAQYMFLRKIVPGTGLLLGVFLSLLIPFSSMRYEFLFFRSNTFQFILIPFVSFVLNDFFKKPRLRHYFYYTLIFFIMAVLGSSTALFGFLGYIGVFSIGVAIYNDWHRNWSQLRLALKRFFILNIISGISIAILGGWIFYGIIFEQVTFGYARDPYYAVSHFFRPLLAADLFRHLSPYFHAGLFSNWSGAMGVEQALAISSWNHLTPLAPIFIVIIIYIKCQNFWEYIAKFVVLFSYAYHEVLYFFPGLTNIFQLIMVVYPPNKLYPYILTYQVILIAIIIQKLKASALGENLVNSWYLRAMSLALSAVYGCLFFLAVGTRLMPETLKETLPGVIGSFISPASSKGSFIIDLAVENIELFHETMNWPSIFFYGFTFMMSAVFFSRYWPNLITMRGGKFFGIALLVNGLLLSWAVYPLNKNSLVWDSQTINGAPLSEIFLPTDRLARVGPPHCRGQLEYEKCIREKFLNGEFGSRRYQVGYRRMVPLEFTKTRSFTPQDSADYIKSFLRIEDTPLPGVLRELQVEAPIYFSKVLDMSAVNYLLSQNPLPKAEHLKLVHKNKQFYLYHNERAWPYYYLADRIETIESYENLYGAEKGVAYLWEDDATVISKAQFFDRDHKLKLVRFEYDDLKFEYSSNKQEFLVIADSWHPNWNARFNGEDIPIFKANGVFKGVLLPRGEGTVHFFFDNAPYRPGIWITIIAWSVFLFSWGWCAFKRPERY